MLPQPPFGFNRRNCAKSAPYLFPAQAFLKDSACRGAARSDVADAVAVAAQGNFRRVAARGSGRLEAFPELGLDRRLVVRGRIAVQRMLPGLAGLFLLAEAPGDVAEMVRQLPVVEGLVGIEREADIALGFAEIPILVVGPSD